MENDRRCDGETPGTRGWWSFFNHFTNSKHLPTSPTLKDALRRRASVLPALPLTNSHGRLTIFREKLPKLHGPARLARIDRLLLLILYTQGVHRATCAVVLCIVFTFLNKRLESIHGVLNYIFYPSSRRQVIQFWHNLNNICK